jgi:hypothetical protein
MQMSKVRKFLIAGATGTMILAGLGASAVASTGSRAPEDRGAGVTPTAGSQQEAEARGRIAEGEREAGDDRGREAEPGDDRGRQAAEAGDDRGRQAGTDDRSGPNRGHDDGANHDRGDDHGSDD